MAIRAQISNIKQILYFLGISSPYTTQKRLQMKKIGQISLVLGTKS